MPKTYSLIQIARRGNREASINLKLRRTWYAEGDAGDQQEDQQGEGKQLPTTVEGWQKYGEALQKRLKERDDKIDLLSGTNNSLADRIKAIEQAQREKLEKDGDYKSLAEKHAAELETLKPAALLAAELEKVIREDNDAIMQTIPESKRSMVPTDYPPQRLKRWLTANAALLTKEPAPNYDAGAGAHGGGGKGEPKVTDDDRRQASIAQANGHNVKPEDIAKRRAEQAKAATNGDK